MAKSELDSTLAKIDALISDEIGVGAEQSKALQARQAKDHRFR